MVKPALMVVIDEEEPRNRLAHDLSHRYGLDYQVIAEARPTEALRLLEALRHDGVAMPIVMAYLWLPEMDGLVFLTRVREQQPSAKRLLIIDYSDPPAMDRLVEGATFGLFDRVLSKQGFPAEEWLYPTVAEFLAEWSRGTARPRFEALQIVGAQWDARAHDLRDLFARNNLPFGFYDAASEAGQRLLAEAGMAEAQLPVVLSYLGQALANPSNDEVASMLGVPTRPAPGIYDVAIVGGGPAGLSAAVYGASEGLHTILFEPRSFGGQASASALIRNYLGFPEGISGMRLGQAAMRQAHFFGAITIFDTAAALRCDGPMRVLTLADGAEIACRTVVIATGVAYRRLGVPALEALSGAGVFYGAVSAEARALRGQEVFVVGAGNSAGQAALHLAGYARQVTILARGEALAESMSDYLIKRIEATGNIDVRLGTQIVDGGGEGRLEWLEVADIASGARERVAASALFVLIGGEPRTDWLAGTVARDEHGYILTGRAVRREAARTDAWPLERPPGLLETSVPGVFAAGDVRYGATKRVATAVGDGALAIRLAQEYLAEQAVTPQAHASASA